MDESARVSGKPAGGDAARKLLFALLILIGLSALFAPLFQDRTDPTAPAVRDGVLSFAG